MTLARIRSAVTKLCADSSAMTRFVSRSTFEILVGATGPTLGHILAIKRFTRSSVDRNGSLHSTVRWA